MPSKYGMELLCQVEVPVPPLPVPKVPVMVESVEVEVHVGTPPRRARTWPGVPVVVVARAEAPLP